MVKLYEHNNIKVYKMLYKLYCKLSLRYSPFSYDMKIRVPHYFNSTTPNILIALRDVD